MADTKRTNYTDDRLLGIVDSLLRRAQGAQATAEVRAEQKRNRDYYHARLVGNLAAPEVDGNSSVVSTDVADTVEWMLPSLVRIFCGGDKVVEFAARRQADEAAAMQATEWCNYVLHRQNPGFMLLYGSIKDALLEKAGILKVWWDECEEDAREVYRNLTTAQAVALVQQPDVEPIEADSRAAEPQAAAADMAPAGAPDQTGAALGAATTTQPGHEPGGATPDGMVHDITVKRRRAGRVRIEGVPQDEFIIDPRARSIESASIVAHRVARTISDLKAAGYNNVDKIAVGDDHEDLVILDDDPQNANNDPTNDGAEEADESMRRVWVTECYLRLDHNGDGIAEWRQVVRCGNVLLRNDECDGPPFVALPCVPITHRFWGTCPADQAVQAQELKTSLWRASLDGLYQSINGRTFAVEGQVNLDDLMVTRPNGVVRVKGPGMVGPLNEGRADLGAAQAFMEAAEVAKENRTGFTRYSQGTNADALNQTATGVGIITNRADSRIELIARVIAETGIRDLFRRILMLTSQNQDRASIARLNGEWVEFDPRTWATEFDFSVNVGIGTGNKDQAVQHLQLLGTVQERGMALGLAGPQQIYATATRLASALGYRQPEVFFTDPSKQPPRPPPPDPKLMQAQAQLQIDQQKAAAQLAMERERMQADIALERERMHAEMALEREKAMLAAQNEAARVAAMPMQLNGGMNA